MDNENVIEFPVEEVLAAEEPQFFADEFFLDESDPGIKIEVKMRGRLVPIYLKRGLTLEDEMAAQAAALKKRVTPDGKVVVDGIDEAGLVEEMLVRCIKSWPFTDRKTGKPFPLTRENIRKMLGGADELAAAIKKLNTEGEAALDPFVVTSAPR